MTYFPLPSVSYPSKASELVPDHWGTVVWDLPAKPVERPADRFLNCMERPGVVDREIDVAFNSISSKEMSKWGRFNGSIRYDICRIKEVMLLKDLLQGPADGRKEFYLLDIGAGDFQWGKDMAEYIEKQGDLPKDITVHIISVRGEKNTQVEERRIGRCKIYEFGQFKVENLIAELKKKGLDVENKVDMIVSHWCFPHLVDPVKTFGQGFNLLRPETGFFLGDGFYFFVNDQKQPAWFLDGESTAIRKRNMLNLLADLNVPFLFMPTMEKIDEFVIRRLKRPCELPMRFTGLEPRPNYEPYYLGSHYVCRYERSSQDVVDYPEFDFDTLYGSKELYEWLQSRELLKTKNWKPLENPADARMRRILEVRERLQRASDDAVRRAEILEARLKAKEAESSKITKKR